MTMRWHWQEARIRTMTGRRVDRTCSAALLRRGYRRAIVEEAGGVVTGMYGKDAAAGDRPSDPG
jgi:hypothetical protein